MFSLRLRPDVWDRYIGYISKHTKLKRMGLQVVTSSSPILVPVLSKSYEFVITTHLQNGFQCSRKVLYRWLQA